jgi:hypothetical protein
VNQAQPQLETVAIPEPPKRLTPDQALAWRELAAHVEPLRVYTVADSLAFEQAALAIALSRKVYASRKACTNERVTAAKAVGYWLTHFGLSPSTRSKVSAAPKVEKADPLAEFLS